MLRRIVWAAVAAAVSLWSVATTAADYKAEYDKKIKASQDVGVLGDGLAGDQINFYTGATSFGATDLSLPGNNGLAVAIGRDYTVENRRQLAVSKGAVNAPELFSVIPRAFGDWDIDVPHISTVMKQSSGWVIDDTGSPSAPGNRCSLVNGNGSANSGVPLAYAPKEMPAVGNYTFPAGDYWHGYDLHVGGSAQSLLTATLPNTQRPSTGGPYKWTTTQNWWVSCLPTTANAAGGEGFLAIAPDGTKYWFDWLSKRKIDDISALDDLGGQGVNRTYYLFRAQYQMMVTRIEDRFGNWVKYNWLSGEFAKLDSITASDGRAIKLTYNAQGLVGTIREATYVNVAPPNDIVLGPRLWQYTYTPVTTNGVTSYNLTQVTQPDGSTWAYNLAALTNRGQSPPYCENPGPPNQMDWNCLGGGVNVNQPVTVDITHPSGAKVEFTFNEHFQLGDMVSPTSANGYSWPLGIVSKRISGAGLAPATWQYAFAPSREQAASDCQAAGCPTKIITDQIDPDGSISRRIFGVVSNQDQTQLLGELQGKLEPTLPSGGSTPITCSPRWGCDLVDDPTPGGTTVPVFYREISTEYVANGQSTPYVTRVGVNPLSLAPMAMPASTYASERRLPVKQRTTTQQGVSFVWQVPVDASCGGLVCFDGYGNPTRVIRSSSGNAGGDSTRTEVSTYAHDTAKWVIGLPATLTDVATGKIVSQTNYNAAMLPATTYSVGVLQQTLTYNADGTVATVKDGRDNVTTLGTSWKRGIPQSITYPNAFVQTAAVNDAGWITSVTDNRGGGDTTVTGYGYDSAGRMALIDYTNADTVAWNDTTRSFVPVATAEYGLPAGHWKQTV
jgi:hypothetical protein